MAAPAGTHRQLEVGGLTFDLTQTGPPGGRPVLLLHGFPQTSRSWSAVAGRLAAAGLRCCAPDQRGYSPGARPAGVDAYVMSELVGDVLGMLDALGSDSVDLVGHDWGAAVGWQVAARHPDRVRTFTAVSVPHPLAFVAALRGADDDQRERSTYMTFFRTPGKPEEVLLRNGAALLRAAYEGKVDPKTAEADVATLSEPGALTAALNWYRAMSSADQNGLGPVTVPTTYVWSTADAAIGRAGAQACGEHVTGPYRFVELPGVSHWIPDEAPDALATEILARIGG